MKTANIKKTFYRIALVLLLAGVFAQTQISKADNSKTNKLQANKLLANKLMANKLKADNPKTNKLLANKLQASSSDQEASPSPKKDWKTKFVPSTVVNPSFVNPGPLPDEAPPKPSKNSLRESQNSLRESQNSLRGSQNPLRGSQNSLRESQNSPSARGIAPSARVADPADPANPSSNENKARYRDEARPARVVDPAVPKRKVFRWLVGPSDGPADHKGKQNVSFEYAQAFFLKEIETYPTLIKEEDPLNLFYDNNSKNHLFYLNIHQDLFQFPYILNWGVRVSAGFFPYKGILNPQQNNSSKAKTADKNPQQNNSSAKTATAEEAKEADNKLFTKEDSNSSSFFPIRTTFFPLSASFIWSLQIFSYYTFTPFFELGASVWNQGFYNNWSEIFPYWGTGAFISFSLLKNSLRYTFPEEYKIQDIGLLLEMRRYLTPAKQDGIKPFLTTFHVGVYFHF